MVVQNVQMLELVKTVDGSLGFLQGGILLLLDLDQEAAEVISRHEPIIGVAVEEALNLIRGRGDCELEPTAEAKADSVSLPGLCMDRSHLPQMIWERIGEVSGTQ
ncbi:unnamed protein product [Linum trigynum]|uniref:Uncharacterized protein n=1 Tax=Linum trigynum TaxID=586398 RepID=A0AAV2D963_9ROSI